MGRGVNKALDFNIIEEDTHLIDKNNLSGLDELVTIMIRFSALGINLLLVPQSRGL